MGDPIGPKKDRRELIWRFLEMCDYHAGWAVFYEVGKENLPLYLDIGLTPLKIGEEARVPLDLFSLEGNSQKKFRYIHNRLEKEGCCFEIISKEDIQPLLPVFKKISDSWLSHKNTREKNFSSLISLTSGGIKGVILK